MAKGRKTGGRHRGTPNKVHAALKLSLQEYVAAKHYDPHRAMIDIACDRAVPLEVRLLCHRELAPYFLPKLKTVEHGGTVEHHHTSEPLPVLFAALEEEEETEREGLPTWRPPALELAPGTDGIWQDLGDEDEEEGEDA